MKIVAAAFVLFVGGWLRVDLVGLLVLSVLALTGLISSQDALAGFRSPAVDTYRVGHVHPLRGADAHRLGQPLQRFAKGSEAPLVAALMIAASLLNTVTVAAIPPNILVTDAMRTAGLRPFGLFEFTPITAIIVATGIVFVVL